MPIENGVVGGRQQPSRMRALTKDLEVLSRHELHAAPFRRGLRRATVRPQLHRGDGSSGCQLRSSAQLVSKAYRLGPGETGRHLVRTMPLSDKKPFGLGYREVAQDDGVQQRKHRRRATDAQGKRQNGNRREHGTATEQPHSEAHVLKNVGQESEHI